MADKFEPTPEISDVEIRLECLRLATEFGPENERRDPLPIADIYYNWVKNSKRQSEKTAKKKTLIEEYKFKDEILNRKIKSINHKHL